MMPITDKLHGNGIKSLLWFEPESVQNPVASEPAYGKTIDLYREHPEWLLQKDDNEKEKSPLFIVNMGIPEAREYLLDKISKIIKVIFMIRGVKPDKTYILTMYDEHNNITTAAAAGRVLTAGYEFNIPEARTSLLVEYK